VTVYVDDAGIGAIVHNKAGALYGVGFTGADAAPECYPGRAAGPGFPLKCPGQWPGSSASR
jgi:hypothetical protein